MSDVKSGASASKFARFPPKTGADACRAQNSVFCSEKPANSSPPSSSPLVTALSPLAFGSRKSGPSSRVPELQGFPRPDSPLRTWLERDSPPRFRPAARQPAELVTAVTAPSGSVFGAKSAQNGRVSDGKFSVESRLQSHRKTGEFQPAEVVSVCHRFVTASSPLSLEPKSAQKRFPRWQSAAELHAGSNQKMVGGSCQFCSPLIHRGWKSTAPRSDFARKILLGPGAWCGPGAGLVRAWCGPGAGHCRARTAPSPSCW